MASWPQPPPQGENAQFPYYLRAKERSIHIKATTEHNYIRQGRRGSFPLVCRWLLLSEDTSAPLFCLIMSSKLSLEGHPRHFCNSPIGRSLTKA